MLTLIKQMTKADKVRAKPLSKALIRLNERTGILWLLKDNYLNTIQAIRYEFTSGFWCMEQAAKSWAILMDPDSSTPLDYNRKSFYLYAVGTCVLTHMDP